MVWCAGGTAARGLFVRWPKRVRQRWQYTVPVRVEEKLLEKHLALQQPNSGVPVLGRFGCQEVPSPSGGRNGFGLNRVGNTLV